MHIMDKTTIQHMLTFELPHVYVIATCHWDSKCMITEPHTNDKAGPVDWLR